MNELIQRLYNTLNLALPGKVTYGTREGGASDTNYIVFQELSKRTQAYADDLAITKVTTFQINLVTKNKDISIEEKLESNLYYAGYEFELVSEFINEDNSINRVYEIKEEVYING